MIHLFRSLAVVCLLMFATAGLALAQLTPEQQADMTLNSARKAFNEKNYPFAAQRFREFLGKFGGHKEANSARFGLAMSMIEGPEKERNYAEIQQFLTPLAADKTFPEQAAAAYQLALSFRTQGLAELARGEAVPAEMPQKREAAKQRFEQAATTFGQALPIFQAKATAPGEKELSPEWEWVALIRCDQAEMLLRLNKVKEAQPIVEPFLKDPNLTRSRYKDLGRYLYGHAAFILGDMATAQKTLSMLAPFSSWEYGPHARYLLARTHHLADERTDALAQYEGAINDHKKHIAEAQLMLKEPQRFKNDPVKRAEIEAFLKQATPDYIARADFHLGVLLYEAGKFAEAKARFQEFLKLFPQSPLKIEAELRIGFCQVQNKEFAEAIKTLTPLAGNEKIADQALLWIGKAQIGSAPDAATKFPEYKNAIVGAINTLRASLNFVARIPDSPDTRARRGEILLEIGDQQQNIKEAREAVNTYQTMLNEKLLADREEEVLLRLAQAWHQAKEYNESDARCTAFFQKFPKSTLSAAAAFTFAENAFFRAAALEKTPPSPDRNKQLAALYDESLKRLQVVLEKYPEYPKIQLVRYSIGLNHYHKGEYDKAAKVLDGVPAAERAGDLVLTPFLIADCILRQTPTTLPADADALAVGKVEEQLKNAAELLDSFVGANPKDANAPDAMLKLGLCQQRRAGMMGDPKDKQATLASARAAYEKLLGTFPTHPLMPNAIYERAKVMVQQGDVGGGTNELRRFTGDPLRQSKIAPMAAINLATLLRAQNQPAQAADVIQKSREVQEGPLSQDPTRANWIQLLRFHQAAALREANKLPEARALFDQVVKQNPKSPEGIEAALRLGQTLKDEGLLRLETGRKMLGNPKEAPQGQNIVNEGYKTIRDAVQFLETTADQLKGAESSQEPRARMYYDAAWGTRLLAEPEVRDAKVAVAKELIKKAGPGAEKLPPPEVSLEQVPLQPMEKKTRGLYQNLIDQFGDVPLSLEARFELAELFAQRNEFEPALKLLNDALDKEPNVDLTEKIRLRLGSIHASKGNLKGALSQFDAVAQNPKSQNLGWAQYRAAEAYLHNKEYPEAVKRLVLFRDNGQYQNIPGLSDRALLRLGHAYAILKAWGESYQALERCVGINPNGPWVDEARYGMGWAMQQQKNYDGAVNWYSQVTARGATELAAKAQFQVGVCRADQKRWPEAANAFMVVPTTYNYPELSAASLLEAAQAYKEANNAQQATQIWERVVREYPNTPFAEAAKERLEKK